MAPLRPGPSRHSVLKWTLPAIALHSPTPAVSLCLLLSWQPGIRVFFCSICPGRQREDGWGGWPQPLPPPFLKNGRASTSLGDPGMGTGAVNFIPGSAQSPLLSSSQLWAKKGKKGEEGPREALGSYDIISVRQTDRRLWSICLRCARPRVHRPMKQGWFLTSQGLQSGNTRLSCF